MERGFIFLQSNPLPLQRTLIRLSKSCAKQSSKTLKGIKMNLAVTFFRARQLEIFERSFDCSTRNNLAGARSVD